MHLLLKNIAWNTEGQTPEECYLPTTVIALDAPDTLDADFHEALSIVLSEAFGFNHKGFALDGFSENGGRLNEVQRTHKGGGFFPDDLATIWCPKSGRT